jgi:hypothetical protein
VNKIIYSVILDVKAPRFGKGEFKKHLVTTAILKDFKKENPEYKNITWKDFLKIWTDICEEIHEEVCTNPLGIKLKFYIGEIKVQYLPYKLYTKMIIPDEHTAIKALNLHSRGKTAILKWERRKAIKFNKWLRFFAFQGCRDLQRKVAKSIKENPDRYRISRITTGGIKR